MPFPGNNEVLLDFAHAQSRRLVDQRKVEQSPAAHCACGGARPRPRRQAVLRQERRERTALAQLGGLHVPVPYHKDRPPNGRQEFTQLGELGGAGSCHANRGVHVHRNADS